MEPRGILRNKEESLPKKAEEEFDRQEVIRNTRLNAQAASESSEGDQIRAQIAKSKTHENGANGNGQDRTHPDHLKWDEINLYKTEQEKAATMKIDEPKTPYEGGFNPEGEYYRDDGDDDEGEAEAIPELLLGSGQFDSADAVSQSLNGGEVLKAEYEESDDNNEEAPPLLAEERHKKFEEMRKAHYKNAASPLKHTYDVPDADPDGTGTLT